MLYYYRIAHGNFGDALNPWLWSRLAPEVCDPGNPTLFLAIGTILNRRVPAGPVKVVFGSGCGTGPPPLTDRKWFFYGVRGPRTAAKLGLAPSLALTDPAILVRRVVKLSQKKVYPASFMPHHQSTFEADWAALCARTGIHFIDPRKSVEQVLADIQQTELLLTEAMHGAIVADALRVPWIPVRLYGQFTRFKWRDWTESLGVPFEPVSIPPVYQRPALSAKGLTHAFKKITVILGLGKAKWRCYRIRPSSQQDMDDSLRALEKLAAGSKPFLSQDSSIEHLDHRLFETLGRIREDWRCSRFKPVPA
jgi:succinoglycan biosynthesis protein ExoV